VTAISYLPEDKHRTAYSKFVLRLVPTIAMVFLLMAAAAQARTRSQEKQPLGSLSSAGQVYVNGSPAPADATLFTGDTVRTGATGTATFTSSVEGTFQVLPGSQIAFNGGDQYLAELQAGAVVVSSQRGPQGLSVRSGSYTVVGATEGELTSAKIEREADGSFAVTCLGGSVILVPAGEGSSGLLIQAGQMVDISPRGKLSSVKEAAAAPAPGPGEAPSTPTPAPASTGISNTTKWIIAGAAIAGGAGAAIALAGGHKSSSVSPSNP
jgi:ferric-dicitrate binding protein FerR (iron transport regulator)